MPSYSPILCYFYPRSPCGERRAWACLVGFVFSFLSTLSLRRATLFFQNQFFIHSLFLSTLSLRRATPPTMLRKPATSRFLSTLSLRRATRPDTDRPCKPCNFYPRSPCGERPGCQRPYERPTTDFYPRSPCGERHQTQSQKAPHFTFLSTLSLRRATARRESRQQPAGISIHALLAESDWLQLFLYYQDNDFYPRSPCGERPQTVTKWASFAKISIHALLAESDNRFGRPIDVQFVFLSTLSLRRAT